ncbi:MAG: hypothetical protein IJN54_14465 [Lachnospiraceae bacterium]|nr:hypothetical protein [Lachnospiraceae bacterium]
MFKYVYIGILAWVFIPLLCFFLLPGIGALFKSTRIKLFVRKIMRSCLGLSQVQTGYDDILYQFGKLECGEIALKNAMRMLGKKDVCNFTLPENSSMKDIYDVAVKHGFSVKGIKETTLQNVDAKIKESNMKVLTLLRVHYPFNGFWVYPTRFFMKLMTSKVDALHWVIIEKVTDKYVEIMDPYFGCIRISHKKFEDVWNHIVFTISEGSR